MDNYTLWQLEKYGNILPEPEVMPCGYSEATEDEMRRQAEWVELQAEQQRQENEY